MALHCQIPFQLSIFDAWHCVPNKRYSPANNGCHLMSTYYVPGIGSSSLNTVSYLTTTSETTYFNSGRYRKLGRSSNFSKDMQLANGQLASKARICDAKGCVR